jgi:hypothetical protein
VEVSVAAPNDAQLAHYGLRLLASAQEDPEGLVSEGPRLSVSVVAASHPWWRRFWWVGLLLAGLIAVAIGLALYSHLSRPAEPEASFEVSKPHLEVYAALTPVQFTSTYKDAGVA